MFLISRNIQNRKNSLWKISNGSDMYSEELKTSMLRTMEEKDEIQNITNDWWEEERFMSKIEGLELTKIPS